MVTKKTPAKKSTSKSVKSAGSSSSATPREVIAKYDCLQLHVKILTILSGLIFLAVVMLGVIMLNCEDCKTSAPKSSSPSTTVEPLEEE